VRVSVRYAPRFVMVSLLDPGSDVVPLGRPVQPDVNSERGRGFQLMNKLMDEVRVRSFPTGGTRVSMLKRLDGE
jgi:anti-sigma regulatory factor (Ser/Thr protein kinase)